MEGSRLSLWGDPLPARTGYVREQRGSSFTRNDPEPFTGPKAPEDSKGAREEPGFCPFLWPWAPDKRQRQSCCSVMKKDSRRFHCLGACGPSVWSTSQHLAWVHEASGIQHGLELPHDLHTHSAHLLLQQLPFAQTNAVFPRARPTECQCSPGRQ